MAQITIDTLNQQDVIDIMSALQSIVIRNNWERIFCPIQEYNYVKNQLDSLSEKFQQQVEELNMDKEIIEAETNKSKSLESKLSELQAQHSELVQKYDNQTEEIKKCYEKLDNYTIDYKPAGTQTEYVYFDVENGQLKKTIKNSAFYKAIKNGDNFEFVYNEEKAPHMKSINGSTSILEPFCEIEGQIPQFSNFIENRGKGIISIKDDELFIIKKAKIRITRK